jgi:bacteriorhodopsin
MAGLRSKYVRARNLLILLWIAYPLIGFVFIGIGYNGSISRAPAIVFFWAYVLLLSAMLVRALRARIRWKRSIQSPNGQVLREHPPTGADS